MPTHEPIRTVKHGVPCIDYGTRTVPDDEYNGLNIGYGWRKHWTIVCGNCHTASPYVLSLINGNEERSEQYGNYEWNVDIWGLKCPCCGNEWEMTDEYYEDEF